MLATRALGSYSNSNHPQHNGPRFLSEAEPCYTVVELEMLAITWTVMKCKIFLTGLQMFEVITDHNPLMPILNTHLLDEVENPRLHQRLMAFSFKAEWCKGTTNSAPDTLPYGSKYSRDNVFMNFVSTLQITKILHSKISVFMSFCITYKQALLKNLPSNESKVLIHGGSALYSRLKS